MTPDLRSHPICDKIEACDSSIDFSGIELLPLVPSFHKLAGSGFDVLLPIQDVELSVASPPNAVNESARGWLADELNNVLEFETHSCQPMLDKRSRSIRQNCCASASVL